MSVKTYKAVDGQSIFDVCLQTYGSLDFLMKLVGDSAFDSINGDPYSGQQFSYDDDLIVDQLTGGSKGSKLATLYSPPAVDKSGSSGALTLITKTYATGQKSFLGFPIPTITMTYTSDTDHFTSGSDGVTSFTMASWIGWDLLAVEHEIKPLRKSDYTWNKSSGLFTMLGGLE
jgi:hypothetical protein